MINAGDMIGGRYRVEGLLGEGGMGAVWLARDRTLERQVAVKFLFERDPRRHQENVQNFLSEARLAASVVHRNVVQIMDFGLHNGDTPYMVMEALEGHTLGDYFDQGAQFTVEEVLQIGSRSLEGLIAVHEAGIVHRDLKPENIFVTKDRGGLFPKLLDFGISRSLDPTGGRRSAITTQAGRVIGTPEYMSPEQASGSAEVTRQSDVYSLGVILYETIAGDVPYRSEHIGDLLMQITRGGAAPVAEIAPEIGTEISGVIQRAMHADPERRFEDAAAMFDAWEQARLACTRGLAAPAGDLPRRAPHRNRRIGHSSATLDSEQFDTNPRWLSQAPAPVTDAATHMLDGKTWVVQRPTGPPRWVLGTIAATLVVAGLIAFGTARLSTNARATPRYIVVQASGEPGAPETSASPRNPANPATTQRSPPTHDPGGGPSAPVAQDEPASRDRRPAGAAPRRAPAQDTGRRVAKAFLRQKQGVVRCLEQHADRGLPKLSVRIRVEQNGHVSAAHVLPETVARSSVGRCIERAVTTMRFQAQREAATYRVPLTARRGT